MSFSNIFDGHMSDEHSLKVIGKIIGRKEPSSITNKDRELIKKSSEIREVNSQITGGLIQKARKLSTLMYPEDLALFLVVAHENGIMDQAEKILEVVEYDRKSMSLSDLMSALAQVEEMPAEWAVGLYGESDQERQEKKRAPRGKSTIMDDLSRLDKSLGRKKS